MKVNKNEFNHSVNVVIRESKKGNKYICLEIGTKKNTIFKLPLRFDFENDSERYAYYRILEILRGE